MQSRMDPAREEILLSHRRTKKGQPLCDCRFGLGRDLKLQRLARALQHNTPPLAHAMRIPNIADLQADEIAGRQFAVQREIEQRQIADTTFRPQPVSDQPNLLRTQCPLLAYFATLVPRRHVAATRLCHLVMI